MKRTNRPTVAANAARPIPSGVTFRAWLAASAVAVAGCENPFTTAALTADPAAQQRADYEHATAVASAAGASLVPPPPAPVAKATPWRHHGHYAGRMPITRWRGP